MKFLGWCVACCGQGLSNKPYPVMAAEKGSLPSQQLFTWDVRWQTHERED